MLCGHLKVTLVTQELLMKSGLSNNNQEPLRLPSNVTKVYHRRCVSEQSSQLQLTVTSERKLDGGG